MQALAKNKEMAAGGAKKTCREKKENDVLRSGYGS